jgi:hypothetical protein
VQPHYWAMHYLDENKVGMIPTKNTAKKWQFLKYTRMFLLKVLHILPNYSDGFVRQAFLA